MNSDQQWLENLWNDHAGSVRAYLQRRVRPSEVDDLLSEIFLVVWRHRGRKPRTSGPWLYGIARKVIATHYRTLERRENLTQRVASQVPLTAQPGGPHHEAVFEALATLDDDDRELLRLSEWEGLSPRQLAQVFGINGPAMRMRLSRARKRFESALMDTNQDIEGATR